MSVAVSLAEGCDLLLVWWFVQCVFVFTSSSYACNSISRKYKRNNSVQSLTLKRTNIHHTSTDTTTYSGQA